MKNILKIAILSIVLIACSSDDNNCVCNNNNSSGNDDNNDTPTTFEPRNIETQVMLKGYSSFEPLYPSTDDYFVIHTQEELDNLIERIGEYLHRLHPSLHNNTFDFDKDQLLVVFNLAVITENSIDITSVTEYKDKIIAVVENLLSDYPGIFPTIPLFPVEVVKMPKIDKPVEFDTSLIFTP